MNLDLILTFIPDIALSGTEAGNANWNPFGSTVLIAALGVFAICFIDAIFCLIENKLFVWYLLAYLGFCGVMAGWISRKKKIQMMSQKRCSKLDLKIIDLFLFLLFLCSRIDFMFFVDFVFPTLFSNMGLGSNVLSSRWSS